jgi:hypothetical protein
MDIYGNDLRLYEVQGRGRQPATPEKTMRQVKLSPKQLKDYENFFLLQDKIMQVILQLRKYLPRAERKSDYPINAEVRGFTHWLLVNEESEMDLHKIPVRGWIQRITENIPRYFNKYEGGVIVKDRYYFAGVIFVLKQLIITDIPIAIIEIAEDKVDRRKGNYLHGPKCSQDDDCHRYVDAVGGYHYCAGDNTCVIDLEVYDYDLYDPRTYLL